MKPAEAYILKQEEPFQSILIHLQLLITYEFPKAELLYKWKIPVYYVDGKQLCYLNAAVKKGYVDVGFWVSDNLKEYDAYLISEGRKVVKSLRYYTVDDIDETIFLTILKEVSLLKQKGFYSKKGS